jgi:hypothetical protein
MIRRPDGGAVVLRVSHTAAVRVSRALDKASGWVGVDCLSTGRRSIESGMADVDAAAADAGLEDRGDWTGHLTTASGDNYTRIHKRRMSCVRSDGVWRNG